MHAALMALIVWNCVAIAKGPEKETADTETKANETDWTQSGYSKSQVGVELLGSGLLYSLNGSYRFTPRVAVNAGIGHFPSSQFIFSRIEYTAIPVSVSYLMGGPNSFLDLSGGAIAIAFTETATPVFGIGSNDNESVSVFGVLGQLGVGYRYWPKDGGFHFKGGALLLVGARVLPWIGLNFGYAF